MKQFIARPCPSCKKYVQIPYQVEQDLVCPECSSVIGKFENKDDPFDRCPCCPCRQFYLSKNFNQLIGCSIMGMGIVLSFWSYGLSLPVFALIDWLLFKNVPYILNCYRCGCEFHGFEPYHSRFKPFLHHIGLKYDKYR